jgi:arylsulfatase A-like enzyme
MTTIGRRDFLGALAGGAAASALAGCRAAGLAPGARAARKPNIVYIMADDLGIGHLGCYGQELIKTPNIDRIAAEGLRFTQCYSGSTVCAPSRSCLMTGQHTGHTTVRSNSAPGPGGGAVKAPGGWRLPLQAEDVTVAEVLKRAGYATGMFGKWGLGEAESVGQPNRQGFDEWFGYLNQRRAHEYYTDYLWHNHERVVLEGNRAEPKTSYSHDLIARRALDFVRRHKDQPFFLYLPFTIPHAKFQVPDFNEYKDRDWPETQKKYAAMVTRMDHDVGRVLALLEQLGLDDNTIVFFTSDNGCAVSGGEWDRFNGLLGFRGKKGNLYEGGLRVPMVARWPGVVRAGTTSDFVWTFWDFLPTAADLAGVDAPPNIDGQSVVPALLGRRQREHEFLYWEIPSGGYRQAVRMGDWKAVRDRMRDPFELYDLRNGIGEKNNLADKHPDVIATIEAYIAVARVESPFYPSPLGKR